MHETIRESFLKNAIPIVKGPTRPKNIKHVKIIFPKGVIVGVIPIESPTVPRADAASNDKLIKSKASVNVRRYIPIKSVET